MVKKLIRISNKPLAQLVKRIDEMAYVNSIDPNSRMIPKQNLWISLKKPHSGDLIVSSIPFSNQYEITLYSSWLLSRKDLNNIVFYYTVEKLCAFLISSRTKKTLS